MSSFDIIVSPQHVFLGNCCQSPSYMKSYEQSVSAIKITLNLLSSISPTLEIINNTPKHQIKEENIDKSPRITEDIYSRAERFLDQEGLDIVSISEIDSHQSTKNFITLKQLPKIATKQATIEENLSKQTLPRFFHRRLANTKNGLEKFASQNERFERISN